MTDHRHWLELATRRPTFELGPADSAELDAHLASCDGCSRDSAVLRADLAMVARLEVPTPGARLRERVREAAAAGDTAGSAWNLATIAAVGLLAAALLGAALGVGAFLARHDDPIMQLDPNDAALTRDLTGKRILWATDVVQLGADRLTIDANGTTFHAETSVMTVQSDPGSLTAWTLEVAWPEAGREQRLNLYFKADAMSWWVSEVRVYDAVAPKQEWATFPPGPHFRTRLGDAFSGDIDLVGQGRGGPVRLRIDGAILAVAPHPSFVQPPGGAAPLASDPFARGGALHCSGILQLRPADAERALMSFPYRLSWRFEYSTGPNTGYADPRLEAPRTGYISGTGIGSDGELIITVEDPNRPMMEAAAFPLDCPAPPSG